MTEPQDRVGLLSVTDVNTVVDRASLSSYDDSGGGAGLVRGTARTGCDRVLAGPAGTAVGV